MDLELAVVISCAGTQCRCRYLPSGRSVDTQYAEPMIEHRIVALPGQLVAVDSGTAPPSLVYRWPDMTVQQTRDGYALAQDGKSVDPESLRQDAFPRIRALYKHMEWSHSADPKQVVQAGYDQIAESYRDWVQSERSEARLRYTGILLDRLLAGARVLDLGCGAGGPTTQALAERFDVTGVDISAQSIGLARRTIPQAHFLLADMAGLDFPPGTFDAVVAFYSLIHVPRQEQSGLLCRIASWLRPGGLLVATMGTGPTEGDYDDFLGAPMYWSSFDGETNRRLVVQTGLEIVSAQEEAEIEHGQPVTFLWIVARKPLP